MCMPLSPMKYYLLFQTKPNCNLCPGVTVILSETKSRRSYPQTYQAICTVAAFSLKYDLGCICTMGQVSVVAGQTYRTKGI